MSQIVKYLIDDQTTVEFEIEPGDGFSPCGIGDSAGRVREAIEPAVAAAQVALERVREVAPDGGVQVKFGVKVTGSANWLVAKAATEGNFEVTLFWQPSHLAAAAAATSNGLSR